MACIKGVNRSASVAISPEGPYLAAGTMAGAVDLSFSSSASLEIFKVDFQSEDRDLPVVGEFSSSERFNRLAWSRTADAGSENFGLGLIAGGLVDGAIDIWNPLSLIRSETSENAHVGHLSRHKGPVRGLEFNILAPNLLASGADDGEVCIWDLANPAEPTHFPPLKGSGSSTQGEISFLSWNRKVQHILATASYAGPTLVWDLKKQKPVISFADSVRRRCSVVQWNPDVNTQLVAASDEDGSPALRLWDMRNIMSPIKEFVGHTKGVIAMSWCPFDSSYLLTCAKDNRTICWDVSTGKIVCELPASTNWNFDVHWYPKNPGVISASSFDGKIGIYNIEGCDRYGAGEADFGSGYLKAPKWYKQPVGVSFGFGGKLVSFNSTSSVGVSEVFVHKVVTEQSLANRSPEFEAAIQNRDRPLLRSLCDKKLQESENEEERETWGILKVMFEVDGTSMAKLKSYFGFKVPEVENTEILDDLSAEISALELQDTTTERVGFGSVEAIDFPTDNGEDFFNNLPSPKADTPVATSGEKFVVETVPSTDHVPQESDGLEESADPAFDESIQHALIVGDYKGAVEKCLDANKMADALIIAHAGSASLWESTRDQYLKKSRAPYLKVVAAIVSTDFLSLINTRPLKFWKETLALLCTFATPDQWTVLCDALASKLTAAGNTLAATICYICAGNIDKTVEIWSRSLTTESEGKSYVDRLQDLMEKTIVLALASGQKQFSVSLRRLVEKYAEILASQGLLTTAMEYLKLFGSDEGTPELEILKHRITLCTEAEKVDEPIGLPSAGGQGNYEPAPYQPNVATAPYPDSNGQYISPYDRRHVVPTPQSRYVNQPHTGYNPAQQQPPMFVPHPTPAQPQPPMFVPHPTPAQPQPPMFVPHPPTHQIQKENLSAPVGPPQPPSSTFVPSNLPPVKNLEQYQQPINSLGSQLYPGGGNLGFQPQSIRPPQQRPGLNPQFGTTPYPRREFTPAPSTVAPGPSIMQPPSSPVHAAPVQPVITPAAPPPTIQTADTSNVSADRKPIIATLTRLFNETSEAAGGARANPVKKREIEDNSKRIGSLFAKLNTGDISNNAAEKLLQLCQALDKGDVSTAMQIQVLLTTNVWDEGSFWLGALKRMLKTRQSVRLS